MNKLPLFYKNQYWSKFQFIRIFYFCKAVNGKWFDYYFVVSYQRQNKLFNRADVKGNAVLPLANDNISQL